MIDILTQFAAGCLGAWCYGYLFSVPVRILWPGCVLGGLSLLCAQLSGEYVFWGTALGALLVGLFSHYFAPRLRVPITPLIIPGIITLVPGISAFNAIIAAIEGDILAGLTGLMNVGAYTIAIALGLSAAEQIFASWRRLRRSNTQ